MSSANHRPPSAASIGLHWHLAVAQRSRQSIFCRMFSAATVFALAFSAPKTFVRRAPPVIASAGATLERAPPAPPPTVGGGGGGGGGDGDDAPEFLRLLNAAEQAAVLQDWTARSRIYKMSDDEALSVAHDQAVAELESLLDFDTSEHGDYGRRMLLGLFKDEEVWAVAGAEVSHNSGLVVSNLVVYPAELNNPDSLAALQLVHALHLLADAIDCELNLSPLRSSSAKAAGLAQIHGSEDDDEITTAAGVDA